MSQDEMSPVERVIKKVITDPAKKVMDRVGLTDADLDTIPQGTSFEEFNRLIDEMLRAKRQA